VRRGKARSGAMMEWKLNRQVKGGVMEWIKGRRNVQHGIT
jgi:hypothetical protein